MIGELFKITYVRNYGAAFSLSFGNLSLNRFIFTAFPAILVVILTVMIYKTKEKLPAFIYALILGGGIGNLIDRVFYGYVIDFLDCDFPNFIMERWPVFNIADSAVVIAITLYIYYEFFVVGKAQKTEE